MIGKIWKKSTFVFFILAPQKNKNKKPNKKRQMAIMTLSQNIYLQK